MSNEAPSRNEVEDCSILIDGDVQQWVNENGVIVAQKIGAGYPEDLRPNAPFKQILPCPYCGSVEDSMRTHDPLRHVNPKLGTKV